MRNKRINPLCRQQVSHWGLMAITFSHVGAWRHQTSNIWGVAAELIEVPSVCLRLFGSGAGCSGAGSGAGADCWFATAAAMASSSACVLGVNGCDGVQGDKESPDGAATAAAIALEDHLCPGRSGKTQGRFMSGRRWGCTLCQTG